ncbi:hypothetical protein [Xanthomonas maliensis]|uniref:hypothetical protein n=1 Tax=Xanthomonas maliensis TaxID=1321368 RepID=UPI0003A03FE9|nr:hypothetical protein [Xanthomonas maliensis]KAB7769348.1 hypothetical protein CKY51_07110 [Xanthomonas maliensis]
MQIPDPVRPYLATIRVVGYCLLGGAVLIGGCKMGQHMERADADSKVASAAKERDKANKHSADYLAAANACGQALSEVSAETRLAERRADEWKAAADAAATNASRATAAAQAKVDSAAKAMKAAKAEPTCASQLAIALCPEIPLP